MQPVEDDDDGELRVDKGDVELDVCAALVCYDVEENERDCSTGAGRNSCSPWLVPHRKGQGPRVRQRKRERTR